MRLVPWNKSKEETLGEINRKMQRALEESLMKNIHLQQVGGRGFGSLVAVCGGRGCGSLVAGGGGRGCGSIPGSC